MSKTSNINQANLFQIGHQTTDGQIECIDIFNGSSKRIVTGTSKGHIDIFDYDTHGIQQINHYEYAHLTNVTGLSTHPTKDNLWISTSFDKSCVLWNKNDLRPASFLIKEFQDCLTDVKWIDDNLILLADGCGLLTVLDPRNTKVMLNQQTVSNRSIHTLELAKNSKTFGVLSDNPIAKIFEIDDTGKLKLIHEQSAHPNILYAMAWSCKEEKTYYVVGENKYAKKITIL
jgi:WD40 repeat protein